jgi:superfamily II DNA or RNA helicase/transcriptional regulator with XRE-family HTH domain
MGQRAGSGQLIGRSPPDDYPDRIKRLRGSLGLTQQALAERLGVSFATVNRWENAQSRPSQLSWNQLRQLELGGTDGAPPYGKEEKRPPPTLDFTADPGVVKVLAEGERLSFGHLANPTFATEISNIDPLPHQRIAVYDHLLRQPRLRFLLADDAGAGKTIMAGLYVREMLSRRLLRRILIVTPAGLLGNWRREMLRLFNLPFVIVESADARQGNPFVGPEGDQVIVSVDTLLSSRMFGRLREPAVALYDLVIFDEAHKLSADRGSDLRVRKTERYCLAESLAGVPGVDGRWRLSWIPSHLLLLTATPHMGKEYPYYALWRLLEPDVLSTPEAFEAYPAGHRQQHFIRRTKEEMVYLDGRPLYPTRISDTLTYQLTQGEVSEQALYDMTTEYLRFVYNRAKLLNREAARLAMSVFQRRLASSTYALLRSFERRIEKLDHLIADVQDGKLTVEQLVLLQRQIREDADVLEAKTADDEAPESDREENETAEDTLLQGVVATSLADLLAERGQVKALLELAVKVHEQGHESKFERLREVLTDLPAAPGAAQAGPKFSGEKLIVFTEHRDTLMLLVRRLNGLGYTGQVAQIHGGMHYTQREEEVERFRKPSAEGGARFLICTDAAGEGINLQFCWLMINYDVPWNPARLEQRMGRIHRYGQRHDPVIILNLVSPSTREGKVLKTLLDKLEKIRRELHSDKVFDCIGRIFAGVSIKQYMEMAVTQDTETVARELDGRLTKEQVQALAAREKSLYGSGGDVAAELPRLRTNLEQEMYFRLLPGYVRQYVEQAAPLVGLAVDEEADGTLSFRVTKVGAMDALLPALELYPERARDHFSVARPTDLQDVIWLHPGEPVFEHFRALVDERLGDAGTRGAVFVDPTSDLPAVPATAQAGKPYLFHLALLSIVRKADPDLPDLGKEEVLDCRLVGVKQYEGAEIALCPVEHLLLLKGGRGLPASAQRLAVAANDDKELARAYLAERIAREMALERKKRCLESLPEREGFIRRGFDYQELELAAARAKHAEKARNGLSACAHAQAGNRKAIEALEEVKQQQRQLAGRRDNALAILRREPELIAPGSITFVVHALVVPSSDPVDREQHDVNVELAAVKVAQAFEEAAGAKVLDVHTPGLARLAGLPDNPGFDLLSHRSENEKRAIEVKGRAGTGDVEVSANEWAKACNLRDGYWLYAVYDCATPSPRLVRVQDPFGRLLAKSKGSVLIGATEIAGAATA